MPSVRRAVMRPLELSVLLAFILSYAPPLHAEPDAAPTSNESVDPPQLGLPEDGGWRYVDGYQEWFPVQGAVAYRAQVGQLGTGFKEVVADTVIAATEWWLRLEPGHYEWRVAATDGSAWSEWSEVWTFESRFPIDNEPVVQRDDALALTAVFPIPSSGPMTIRLRVPRMAQAGLRVYDVLGREVALLHLDPGPGEQELVWEPGSLPAGTYFLRLGAGRDWDVKRVVLAE
jgi:hypothetical protein